MPASLIYLSLGTNLGDRRENLRLAHNLLPPVIQVVASSSIYETDPWGYPDQPAFLNQVVQVETRLPPPALLVTLKDLERVLGRRPTFRYGPRLIDLDILIYGSLVIETPMLTIPHQRLAERAFVLVPMVELAPNLIHPLLGLTMQQLLQKTGNQGVSLFAAVAKQNEETLWQS